MMKGNRSKITIYAICAFLFLLVAASFFMEFGTKTTEPQRLIYSSDGKVQMPPFSPSFQHLLGTDKNGNDLLIKLLIGFKYTFFVSMVVAFLRMLLGTIGSLFILFYLKRIKAFIGAFLTPFLYVPAFILFIHLAKEEDIIIQNQGAQFFVFYQMLDIVLIGTPPSLSLLIKEFEQLLKKDYVIASRLLGASNFHLVVKQLLPIFKKRFYIVFIQQAVTTIILLIHLGVFQVFIGGKAKGGIIGEDDGSFLSNSNEWGGMIGQSLFDMIHYPRLLFIPAFALTGLILLLNLLIKQLEKSV